LSENSWKSLIGDARRDNFVGRGAELDACRTFVDEKTQRVLYIQGVGGIGKTTLLRELKSYASEQGWQTKWLDAAVLGDSGPEIERAFLDAADSHGDGNVLLFVDNFEEIAPLDGWMRDSLFPKLPSNLWLAMAGRPKLSHNWRLDSAWSKLTRVIPLPRLSDEACKEFLAAKGVDEERHDEIVSMVHGMPIALALAAENALEGTETSELLSASDISDLFERLAQQHMSPSERRALEVAGLAWAVNEDILDVALDDEDPEELMIWLAQRPYMQVSADGLQPHPVVRKVIDDEFRRHSPARRSQIRERLAEYYLNSLRHNEPIRGAHPVFQLYYMARGERGADTSAFTGNEQLYVARCQSELRVREHLLEYEGPRSSDIAAHWLERFPRLAFELRNQDDDMRAFVQFLKLEECDAADRQVDPMVDLALRELDELSSLREGETARMARFWFSAEDYQERGPMQTRIFVLMWNHMAWIPGASYGAMVAQNPEEWKAREDRTMTCLGEHEIDDKTFAVFCRDWRRYSALDHIRFRYNVQLTGRAPSRGPRPRYDVLSREEFEDAVRDALKNFHRGDRLAANALVRSRAARLSSDERDDPSVVEARLRDILDEAIASLGDDGEDQLHKQVLQETFVETATKQRAVADKLAMSFSTYRRKLNEAVDRVTNRLWHHELQGEYSASEET
jgi:hypothetical protein